MSPETRKALEQSIEHWEHNLSVGVIKADIYADACSLCFIFRDDHACRGCPVMEETGIPECVGSPWVDCRNARVRGNAADFALAARLEIQFLKSLLPEETNNV